MIDDVIEDVRQSFVNIPTKSIDMISELGALCATVWLVCVDKTVEELKHTDKIACKEFSVVMLH